VDERFSGWMDRWRVLVELERLHGFYSY
jgi:hypothetical protein